MRNYQLSISLNQLLHNKFYVISRMTSQFQPTMLTMGGIVLKMLLCDDVTSRDFLNKSPSENSFFICTTNTNNKVTVI